MQIEFGVHICVWLAQRSTMSTLSKHEHTSSNSKMFAQQDSITLANRKSFLHLGSANLVFWVSSFTRSPAEPGLAAPNNSVWMQSCVLWSTSVLLTATKIPARQSLWDLAASDKKQTIAIAPRLGDKICSRANHDLLISIIWIIWWVWGMLERHQCSSTSFVHPMVEVN